MKNTEINKQSFKNYYYLQTQASVILIASIFTKLAETKSEEEARILDNDINKIIFLTDLTRKFLRKVYRQNTGKELKLKKEKYEGIRDKAYKKYKKEMVAIVKESGFPQIHCLEEKMNDFENALEDFSKNCIPEMLNDTDIHEHNQDIIKSFAETKRNLSLMLSVVYLQEEKES